MEGSQCDRIIPDRRSQRLPRMRTSGGEATDCGSGGQTSNHIAITGFDLGNALAHGREREGLGLVLGKRCHPTVTVRRLALPSRVIQNGFQVGLSVNFR